MTPWHFTILGYKAGFAQPWFLAGILVALALGLTAIVVSARRGTRVKKTLSERLAPALKKAVEAVKAGEPALVDVVTQPR